MHGVVVRGAVVLQPSIALIRIDFTWVWTVVCGVLGQHVSEHPLAPSPAVSLAQLHDDIPPTA